MIDKIGVIARPIQKNPNESEVGKFSTSFRASCTNIWPRLQKRKNPDLTPGLKLRAEPKRIPRVILQYNLC